MGMIVLKIYKKFVNVLTTLFAAFRKETTIRLYTFINVLKIFYIIFLKVFEIFTRIITVILITNPEINFHLCSTEYSFRIHP